MRYYGGEFQIKANSLRSFRFSGSRCCNTSSQMPEEIRRYKDQFAGRCILIRAEVIPIEAIVRGYITDAGALSSYRTATYIYMHTPSGLAWSE